MPQLCHGASSQILQTSPGSRFLRQARGRGFLRQARGRGDLAILIWIPTRTFEKTFELK